MADERNRWQGRFEVLAALAASAAAAVIAGAGLTAWSTSEEVGRAQVLGSGVDLLDVVRYTARSVTPLVAALLVVAYVLVVLGPSERIGSGGRIVLGTLVGGGLVLGVAAGGAALDLIVNEQTGSEGLGPIAFPGSFSGGMERLGAALPSAAAAALCGYVAWLAWTAMPAARAASDAVGHAEQAGPADGAHAPGEPEGGHDPGDDAEPEAG